MKIIKIAFGSALAIILANLLHLHYSTAAGVITLLTIQDTMMDTINISKKRLFAFIITTLLSFAIFNTLGFQAISFGIYLLFFVWICYKFELQEGIAMNSVLATHYLLEQNTSLTLIGNEFLLLIIGAGLGTILNLFMPSNVKHIRNTQAVLEDDLRLILSRMSIYIRKESKQDFNCDCFLSLDSHIQTGIKHAYANMKNNFLPENQYFLDYMQMRKQQSRVLKNIYEKIHSLDFVPPQANDIAVFIEHIASSLQETNNASGLLSKCSELFEQFKESELPVSRNEFEARAILFMLLKDFEYFLRIKQEFSNSLTKEQIQKFWIQ